MFNSFSVSHYVVEWLHKVKGANQSSIVPWWVHNYIIEDLESYEEYEVTVRAVNEKGESSDAVKRKTKTETKGKYLKHFL
jgi:hypothetical protein